MFPTVDWVGFGIVSLAIAASPGPATAYVMACSLKDGCRSGLAAAAGLVAGSVVLGALCAFGVSAVPAAVPAVVDVICAVAPIALLVMAARMGLASARSPSVTAAERGDFPSKRIPGGLLITLANPSQYAVFLFVASRFLMPDEQTMFLGHLVLNLLYTTIAAMSYLAVVLVIGVLLTAGRAPLKAHRFQRWGSPAVLAGIALYLLTAPHGLAG